MKIELTPEIEQLIETDEEFAQRIRDKGRRISEIIRAMKDELAEPIPATPDEAGMMPQGMM